MTYRSGDIELRNLIPDSREARDTLPHNPPHPHYLPTALPPSRNYATPSNQRLYIQPCFGHSLQWDSIYKQLRRGKRESLLSGKCHIFDVLFVEKLSTSLSYRHSIVPKHYFKNYIWKFQNYMLEEYII